MRGVRGGVLTAVVLIGACLDPPPGIEAQQVCEAFCACSDPLGDANVVCNAECVEDLSGLNLPDACLACTDEATCGALDACFATCFGGSRGVSP